MTASPGDGGGSGADGHDRSAVAAAIAVLRSYLGEGDLSCLLCDRGAAHPIAIDLPVAFGAPAFVGTARTVRTDSGTLKPIRTVLNDLAEDDLPVIDARRFAGAVFGGRLAARSASRGAAGVIVLGRVRDVDALDGGPLGIRAAGVAPHRSSADDAGAEDPTLRIARTEVRPGDVAIVDRNGVAVLPRAAVRSVVERLPSWIEEERADDRRYG